MRALTLAFFAAVTFLLGIQTSVLLGVARALGAPVAALSETAAAIGLLAPILFLGMAVLDFIVLEPRRHAAHDDRASR